VENSVFVVSTLKGGGSSAGICGEERRGRERSKEWVNCLPFERAGLENIFQLMLSI